MDGNRREERDSGESVSRWWGGSFFFLFSDQLTGGDNQSGVADAEDTSLVACGSDSFLKPFLSHKS